MGTPRASKLASLPVHNGGALGVRDNAQASLAAPVLDSKLRVVHTASNPSFGSATCYSLSCPSLHVFVDSNHEELEALDLLNLETLSGSLLTEFTSIWAPQGPPAQA